MWCSRTTSPAFPRRTSPPTLSETYSSLDLLGRWHRLCQHRSGPDAHGGTGQHRPSQAQRLADVKYDIVDGSTCTTAAISSAISSAVRMPMSRTSSPAPAISTWRDAPFEKHGGGLRPGDRQPSSTGSLPSFRALSWWPGACRWRPSRWRNQGEGICFNVYVYTDQPGITIDYATGASSLEGDALPEDSTQKEPEDTLYILNTSSGKFHLPPAPRRLQ